MPYELELRDGQPGINVQRQIQRYGRPGEVEIPNWLEATHITGTLWLTTPKTRAARRFVPISTQLWNRLWDWIRANNIGMRDFVFTSARRQPRMQQHGALPVDEGAEGGGLPQVKIHSAHHWMGDDGRPREHARRRAHSCHGPHQHADDHAVHPPRRRLAWPAHGPPPYPTSAAVKSWRLRSWKMPCDGGSCLG